MKPTLILLSLVVMFLSCKTMLLKRFLKDPKIETAETIKAFQNENGFTTQNSLILKADSGKLMDALHFGLSQGLKIYNSAGEPICYLGTSDCSGVEFKEFMNDPKSYKPCRDTLLSLREVLKSTYTLNRGSVTIDSFPTSDYYVVMYWQKFLGGKKGYENDVNWIEKEIGKSKSPYKITFVKINADLQDTWGLEPGQKVSLKWKKQGKQLTMSIELVSKEPGK